MAAAALLQRGDRAILWFHVVGWPALRFAHPAPRSLAAAVQSRLAKPVQAWAEQFWKLHQALSRGPPIRCFQDNTTLLSADNSAMG